MTITPQKWRPSLGMVVISMLIFILCLPITGIWLFRFYDSQLVRETEQELIVQAAFIEAFVVNKLKANPPSPDILGINIKQSVQKNRGQTGQFLKAKLDLATDTVFPPRANPKTVDTLPDPLFLTIGRALDPILEQSQKITLAGFRVLDPNGIVIAGRSDIGESLAHVPEVQTALAGRYDSVLRQRISSSPNPPIYTISRGTGIRVFVTLPIVYKNRVAGVVYLSRTPSHFLRELYGQRWKIALAVLSMLLITFIIAYVFIRTIKGPIEALNQRSIRIAKGEKSALKPLDHHGTRELASLSESLLSMSKKIRDRSDYINTFAAHVSHELKSPLTSIQGAAELMLDSVGQMSESERKKFLTNMMSDTDRLSKLLDRLRDLAEADNSESEGDCNLADELEKIKSKFPDLEIDTSKETEQNVHISAENVDIIFSNLLANSEQHGAKSIQISAFQKNNDLTVSVRDDGAGISELNRDKIFQLFFTTKREAGGTGMGLGIIQSLLNSHGGKITHVPTDKGTRFDVYLPTS